MCNCSGLWGHFPKRQCGDVKCLSIPHVHTTAARTDMCTQCPMATEGARFALVCLSDGRMERRQPAIGQVRSPARSTVSNAARGPGRETSGRNTPIRFGRRPSNHCWTRPRPRSMLASATGGQAVSRGARPRTHVLQRRSKHQRRCLDRRHRCLSKRHGDIEGVDMPWREAAQHRWHTMEPSFASRVAQKTLR